MLIEYYNIILINKFIYFIYNIYKKIDFLYNIFIINILWYLLERIFTYKNIFVI